MGPLAAMFRRSGSPLPVPDLSLSPWAHPIPSRHCSALVCEVVGRPRALWFPAWFKLQHHKSQAQWHGLRPYTLDVRQEDQKFKVGQAMVMHAFNPNTQKAEAGRAL